VPTTTDLPARRDLTDELTWLRSLRASRARRDEKAARRRRRLTGRRGLVVAVVGLAFVASGSMAADTGTSAPSTASSFVVAIQQRLGVTADGIAGPQTRAAIKAFQARNGLTVDGIAGSQTVRALGLSAAAVGAASQQATLTTKPPVASTSTLSAIAQCESGGNPGAISADGAYRGKYQFTRASWQAVGGSGDPAVAPESEQDQRAAALYAKQGARAWPVCASRA
jgi:peptidoglycan hydrolase-like protein with peptidoglycan-binding domain